MWVKICANTTLEDAQLAAHLGADAVGFIFAPSKRQVTAEQVSKITDHLPPTLEKVGVFATDDSYEIEHHVACAGLTAAQLHRAFDASMVHALSAESGGELKIIQTVAYTLDASDRTSADANFVAQLRETLAEPAIWAVLIDAAKSGVSGGLGLAFNWAHVRSLVGSTANEHANKSPHIILAGGLNSANVGEAIADFAPWGIDVASGVEASPGVKDPAKLCSFLAAARAARPTPYGPAIR